MAGIKCVIIIILKAAYISPQRQQQHTSYRKESQQQQQHRQPGTGCVCACANKIAQGRSINSPLFNDQNTKTNGLDFAAAADDDDEHQRQVHSKRKHHEDEEGFGQTLRASNITLQCWTGRVELNDQWSEIAFLKGVTSTD